ncbi:hypothetical protein [Neomegalonema sp.]|uniref:hypothetical protein n=1 Tax=Neomegalonema sp. TaxID=2039713 RepID=UPI00261BFA6B|nr:hypothetical protein [Neomegalonema sp.]MDD2867160.1 hypothetical protein [Neomegalonema sp.]
MANLHLKRFARRSALALICMTATFGAGSATAYTSEGGSSQNLRTHPGAMPLPFPVPAQMQPLPQPFPRPAYERPRY